MLNTDLSASLTTNTAVRNLEIQEMDAVSAGKSYEDAVAQATSLGAAYWGDVSGSLVAGSGAGEMDWWNADWDIVDDAWGVVLFTLNGELGFNVGVYYGMECYWAGGKK